MHALLLRRNRAAALYNIFYVCAKSGLDWSSILGWDHCSWSCLGVWRTRRQKIASVSSSSLLWAMRAQDLSLVLRWRCCSLVRLSRTHALFYLSFSCLGIFSSFPLPWEVANAGPGFLLWLTSVVSIFTSICHPDTTSIVLQLNRQKVGSLKHLMQPGSYLEVKVNSNKILCFSLWKFQPNTCTCTDSLLTLASKLSISNSFTCVNSSNLSCIIVPMNTSILAVGVGM